MNVRHIQQEIILFVSDLWRSRFIIIQLTKRDFQNKYMGSYLGIPWAFLKPLTVVAVMWFAFSYGLKVGKVDGTVPFSLWLMVGIIPWFYISENVMGSVPSLLEYSFLIKNIRFRPSIIPLIKILTNSLIHLFFIFVIMIVSVAYGYPPSLCWLQVIYFMTGAIVFTLGIAWGLASINVFFRDTSHLVEVAVQLFFWGTPILWSQNMLPPKILFFIKLNPVCYLIEGYRATFISQTWFYENWKWALYFWCVTLLFFLGGGMIFKQLKPHFADVL